MKLLMRYTLTNGETVEQRTDKFASVEEANGICAQMLSSPRSTVTLQGPDGSRMVNTNHIVYITVDSVVTA